MAVSVGVAVGAGVWVQVAEPVGSSEGAGVGGIEVAGGVASGELQPVALTKQAWTSRKYDAVRTTADLSINWGYSDSFRCCIIYK